MKKVNMGNAGRLRIRQRIAAALIAVMFAAGASVTGTGIQMGYCLEESADSAAVKTETQDSGKSTETASDSDEKSAAEDASGASEKNEGDTQTSAASGIVSAEGTKVEEVDVSGADKTSENELKTLEDNQGVVLFANTSSSLKTETNPAPAKDKVVLKYSRWVRYEGYSTHYFKVTFDGKTRIAYCVQPKLASPSQGTKTAEKYSSKLMTKALYYSYGYPGYDKRTRSYVSKKDIDDYDDDYGAYALSHMVLSYIYDKKSNGSDAFIGVSSETKKIVKTLTEAIEDKWPDPPSDASLSLSPNSVTAAWDSKLQQQKTPVMKLKGHSDNRIYVKVPKNCTMVKKADGSTKKYAAGNSTTKKVKVFAGDSFYFTAPASKTGTYKSAEMEGALSTFQPYIIKPEGRQNIVFCGVGATTSVYLKIKWAGFGSLKLVKKSSQPGITDGNGCYSLKGAVYGLYLKSTGKLVRKLTVDKTGRATATGIAPGKYYIKEISSPEGYALDETVYNVTISTKRAGVNVKDKPRIAAAIRVLKKDSETGNTDKAYGASLEGAEYTVKYYDGYYDKVSDIGTKKALRTWTVKTDKKGCALLDKDHFVSGDDFYTDGSGNVILPLGTVTVSESKAPAGYLKGNEIYVIKLRDEKSRTNITDVKTATHEEQVIRGDVAFTKIHGGTGKKLAGIPFEITSEDTGETIVITTDESGRLTTISSGKHIGSKEKGSYAENKGGTLPYGSYVLNEVRCEANKGLQLVTDLKFSIKKDSETVDLGEVTDNEIKIGTSASDDSDGDRTVNAGGSVSITDRVVYEGLEAGQEYTIKGVLMDKETGGKLMINGRNVTSEKKFTPDKSSGSVDVNFSFEGTGLGGKDLVIFETLYENEIIAAEHKDINCAEQTIKTVTYDSSAETGDTFPRVILCVLIVSAAACMITLLGRRRQR